MKGIRRMAAAMVVVASTARGEPPDLPADPTLADFRRVAELRNPGLEAVQREWRAQSERVDEAGSWPDPSVSFGWFVESVETRVGPQEQKAALRQRLPWFGTLGLERDVASAGAEAAREYWEESRLALRRDVTRAWYDLYWVDRAVDLTREGLDLLSNLERVVREKYRIGAAEHADLIRLQVELGVVEERLRSLEEPCGSASSRCSESRATRE